MRKFAGSLVHIPMFCCANATEVQPVYSGSAVSRVLLMSIDGMHAAGLALYVTNDPGSMLARNEKFLEEI
jgi:hypothetical protein